MSDNKECETCNKKCYPKCFNKHVGSTIALQKMLEQTNVNAIIVDGNPQPIETVKEK